MPAIPYRAIRPRAAFATLLPLGYAASIRPVSEKIRIDSNLIVPMRDAVKLYADLSRPARDARFPTLIVRTPYGKQRNGIHQTKIQFAQRGYAVLVHDVRRRYKSEGAWDPFRAEARDGFDTSSGLPASSPA